MIPSLPRVALCCIDTANHALAREATRFTAGQCDFGHKIYVSDRRWGLEGFAFGEIAPIAEMRVYNRLVLKALAAAIPTDFVLLIQFDGFVVNPGVWTDEFLGYDYVGAPWRTTPPVVGNGGFSLRSARLLQALQDPAIEPTNEPEDVTICRTHRAYLETVHGIRFAPEDLAERFSIEAAPPMPDPRPSFGFHGLSNLTSVYDTPDKGEFLIDNLAPYVLSGLAAVLLVLRLIREARGDEAGRLLRRCLEHRSLAAMCADARTSNRSDQPLLELAARIGVA